MKKKVRDLEYGELYREYMKVIVELEKYKEVEQEIGVDLITLIKAYKNGIYIKTEEFEKEDWAELYYFQGEWQISPLGILTKDYGKTWALTKEELEGGNQ